MLVIDELESGSGVFRALGSDIRMQIVKLLSENGEMNMQQLAAALQLTKSAMTSHIRLLESAGILEVDAEHGGKGKGNEKRCRLKEEEILIRVGEGQRKELLIREKHVPIGAYRSCSVEPACGMASLRGWVGKKNDPAAFSLPQRTDAGVLWYSGGYLEYGIRDLQKSTRDIVQITIFAEMAIGSPKNKGSGSPAVAFYLNGARLCSWIGEVGADSARGIYTPKWWKTGMKQHGLLKMIVVNQSGTFFDGIRVSDVCVTDLHLKDGKEMLFRMGVNRAGNVGEDLVLFGTGFGNYNQDIMVRVHYTKHSEN